MSSSCLPEFRQFTFSNYCFTSEYLIILDGIAWTHATFLCGVTDFAEELNESTLTDDQTTHPRSQTLAFKYIWGPDACV